MSLNAKFQADFTSFYDAVEKAETKMADFSRGAGTVERSLNRLVDSFSGRSIIQQASLAADAVERIGGTSKLTEAELQKLGAQAQQAVEKMSALGVDVPPKLQQIADAAKNVNSEHVHLLGTLTELAAAFGVAFSVEAAVEFLKTAAEEARTLNDLSLQTRINVEDLQVLGAATRAYGIDGEQLGRALFQLQQRIAGGDQSVVTAYHLMGMSIDEVKDKNALDLFLMTERGLGTLSGAIQDTAAKDLYGGRLGASLIAFSSNVDDAMTKARAFNTIASTESVKAAAEYSIAIEAATKSVHAMVIELEGRVAQGVNVLVEAVDKGAGKWSLFGAMLKDFATHAVTAGAGTHALADLLDDLNQKTERQHDIQLKANAATGAAAGALTAQAAAAKFMATTQLDAQKPLLDWQEQYLRQLNDIGDLNAQTASAIGVNASQFEKYNKSLQAAIEAEKKYAEALTEVSFVGKGWQGTLETLSGSVAEGIKFYLEAGVAQDKLATFYGVTATQVRAVALALKDEVDQQKIADFALLETTKLWDEYTDLIARGSGTAFDQAGAAVDRWAADITARMQRAGADTDAFYEALGAVVDKKWKQLGIDASAISKDLTENTQRGLQQTADRARATYEEALKYVGIFSSATIQHYRDVAEAAQFAADTFGSSFVANAQKAEAAIEQVSKAQQKAASFALAGNPTPSGIYGPLTQQQLRDYGFVDLRNNVTKQGEQAGYGTSGSISGIGRRAAGGPVTFGTPYLVGEKGPELFVPSGNGTIVPNGAAGGVSIASGAIAVTVQYPMMNDARAVSALADLLGNEILQKLRPMLVLPGRGSA